MRHHAAMKHHVKVAAVAGAAVLAAAVSGCSGSGNSSSGGGSTHADASTAARSAEQAAQAQAQAQTTAPATVTTMNVSPLGKILVNDKNLSLYLFQADKSTTSTCTGACAKLWPPLLVNGTPTVAGGVDQKKLGTSKRSDGGTQVTYDGHPLYRFAADTSPGNVRGQGLNNFGAKWYVLGTDGKAITKSASSSSSAPPSGNGY